MKILIGKIPNMITSLNLLSGSVAIFFAIDGHLTGAGILICLAAVFDFLDGLAARLLKAYSETGKQLDSLADLVSFGLAPGAILFTLLEYSLLGKNQLIFEISLHWSEWLVMSVAFLSPLAGAVRLARFNVNPGDSAFFRGLPIPANGLFWASLGLILGISQHREIFELVFSSRNLVLLGIFIPGMMVINLPMFSLKLKNLNLRENWYRFLFLAIALIFLLVFNVYGIALTVSVYIFFNFLLYILGVKYS